jgi:hypothetical protein
MSCAQLSQFKKHSFGMVEILCVWNVCLVAAIHKVKEMANVYLRAIYRICKQEVDNKF